MSDKEQRPPYSVNIVEKTTDAGGQVKDRWTEVGIAFQHKDGKGFNVKLPASILIRGDANIVLREISPRSSSGAQNQGGASDPYTFTDE